MKRLSLIVLFLALFVMCYGQWDKSALRMDTTQFIDTYFPVDTVISTYPDTIAVVMLVCDTTMHGEYATVSHDGYLIEIRRYDWKVYWINGYVVTNPYKYFPFFSETFLFEDKTPMVGYIVWQYREIE